ncbi:MAG: ATP-binding protein, partial [Tissierellia bacterium]|nr:ATP-binding protein [Tissierellia bacterium]
GIGIPKEKIETIFDRFEQVDKSLTRKREGSGIGLSIVKTLVELHGGNINVISKLGVGSEFIFKLPVAVINEKIVDKSTSYESKIDKISIEFSDIYN